MSGRKCLVIIMHLAAWHIARGADTIFEMLDNAGGSVKQPGVKKAARDLPESKYRVTNYTLLQSHHLNILAYASQGLNETQVMLGFVSEELNKTLRFQTYKKVSFPKTKLDLLSVANSENVCVFPADRSASFCSSSMVHDHLPSTPLGIAVVRQLIDFDFKRQASVWFDASRNCLEIFEPGTRSFETIFCSAHLDPGHVLIDYVNWILFWRRRKDGAVLKTSLVSRVEEKVLDETEYPIRDGDGIKFAIDPNENRIYWISDRFVEGVDYFESSSEELTDLQEGSRGIQLVFDGMTMLYWIEVVNEQYSIMLYDLTKGGGSPSQTVMSGRDVLNRLALKVKSCAEIDLRPDSCTSAGCSHFCARATRKSRDVLCWCPPGLILLPDGKTCQSVPVLIAPAPAPVIDSSRERAGSDFSVYISVGVSLLIICIAVVMLAVRIRYRNEKILRRRKQVMMELFEVNQVVKSGTGANGIQQEHQTCVTVVSKELLHVSKETVIKEGNFGIVYEGNYESKPVAIKTLKDGQNVEILADFVRELLILQTIGVHEHVVRFYGVEVSDAEAGKILAVFELSPYGNLRKFILQSGNTYRAPTVLPAGMLLSASSPTCAKKLDENEMASLSAYHESLTNTGAQCTVISVEIEGASNGYSNLPEVSIRSDADSDTFIRNDECENISVTVHDGNENLQSVHNASTVTISSNTNQLESCVQPLDIRSSSRCSTPPSEELEADSTVACIYNDATEAADRRRYLFPHRLLLDWGQQIAEGMGYLTEKNIIHGDLATRNILVFDGDVLKISDFEFARNLNHEPKSECVTKKNKKALPWRWAAPEVLSRKEVTTKADVWSFGVTLWEIFTLGKTPFLEYEWTPGFVSSLEDGTRLERPKTVSTEMFEQIFLCCWNLDADQRPSFTDLVVKLAQLKANLIN